MKEYIEYWNDFMANWIEHPDEMFNKDLLKIKHSERNGKQLVYDFLPQPYLGNPYECSAITLNLNPGGLIDSRKHPNGYFVEELKNSKNYFEYAKEFPQLKKNSPFWNNQINWINRLVDQETENNKLPFAIEICHWHSEKWKNFALDDDELIDYFEKMVFDIIDIVIKNSSLKTVLSIGKQYTEIYKKLAFEKLLEISNENYKDFNLNFPLNKQNKPSNRVYTLWQSKTGTKYLNTYTVSNKPPSSDWLEIDKYLIDFKR